MIEKCSWPSGIKHCTARDVTNEDFKLPNYSCFMDPEHCRNCITANRTLVWAPQVGEWVDVQLYALRFFEEEKGAFTTIKCSNKHTSQPCTCIEGTCKAPQAVCDNIKCDEESECECEIVHGKHEWHYSIYAKQYSNPTQVTFAYCVFKYETKAEGIIRRKREASAKQKVEKIRNVVEEDRDLPFLYDGINVICKRLGELVLAKDGIEYKVSVEKLGKIPIPDEFFLYPGPMQIMFSDVSQEFHIKQVVTDVLDECARIECLVCWDRFHHLNCLPSYIYWSVIGIFASLALYIISNLIKLIKTLVTVIKSIYLGCYYSFRCSKSCARIIFRVGLRAGERVGNFGARFIQALNAMEAPPAQVMLVIILAFPTIFATRCNDNKLIETKVYNCVTDGKGESCSTEIQAEVTLTHLQYSVCMVINDTYRGTIATMKITYQSLECEYATELQYFTFPVSTKKLYNLYCPYDSNCQNGAMCMPDKYKPVGQEEAFEWPGITDCHAGTQNMVEGCGWYPYQQPCHQYRVYFIPKYRQSHSVSRIEGKMCLPQIAVSVDEGEPILIQETSTVSLFNGQVEITGLGTFDQLTSRLPSYLITKVNAPLESHLHEASPKNIPRRGEIGEIQATSEVARNFLFPKDKISVKFINSDMHLTTSDNYLEKIIEEGTHKLPRRIYQSKLFMTEDGKLKSIEVSSRPLKIHLVIKNATINIQTIDICPHIRKVISIVGCYTCINLATVTLEAKSHCQPGLVSVTFAHMKAYTRAVQLTQQLKEIEIQFRSETRCFSDSVCLGHKGNVKCVSLDFCLDHPDIELKALGQNFSITEGKVNNGLGSWFNFAGNNGIGSNPFSVTSWMNYGKVILLLMIVLSCLGTLGCVLSFVLRIKQLWG